MFSDDEKKWLKFGNWKCVSESRIFIKKINYYIISCY